MVRVARLVAVVRGRPVCCAPGGVPTVKGLGLLPAGDLVIEIDGLHSDPLHAAALDTTTHRDARYGAPSEKAAFA